MEETPDFRGGFKESQGFICTIFDFGVGNLG